MNAKSLKWIVATLAWAALSFTQLTRGDVLGVGDAAPALQVSQWAQGDPVDSFERGKAYLVEFWATWCGPCRTSIPHLNDLHAKYQKRGLVVIGQDVWEDDPSAVAPFIKQMGDKMTYRVALDLVKDGDRGQMAETWMEAADQHGIPTAFLVDQSGAIAWIGHPMTLEEPLIEQVLDGKFDLAKATAAYREARKLEDQLRPLWKEFGEHRDGEAWTEALAVLDKITERLPEDRREETGAPRFELLLSSGQYQKAYQLAEKLNDANQTHPMFQNELAWVIATKDGVAERDLVLAEKIARQADKSTEGKNAEIIDTLARVLYLKGEREEAITLQEKAVKFAEGRRQQQFQDTLDSYKAGKEPKPY